VYEKLSYMPQIKKRKGGYYLGLNQEGKGFCQLKKGEKPKS
jgi:hypothetical protein